VSEQSRVMASTVMGALIGAAVGYLFFTERGRVFRDRMEPAMDDLRHEFGRFQRTIEKVGEMASEGMRVVQEFNAARSQSQYPTGGTH
jgi:gas vesicle protein